MPIELDIRQPDFEARFTDLLGMKRETDADVTNLVADIIRDVQDRGDVAVTELTNKFDRLSLTPDQLRLTDAEIDDAMAKAPADELDALKLAADRIRDFHERSLPASMDYTDDAGVGLGMRWNAVEAAGLYVPGGLATYPSSVLMNAIPAKAAGVDRLVMCVPTPDGELNPLVMAAARLAGVDAVYRIGGAQAIAAMAYGTESLDKVDVVVGPGNAFVAAAKRQIYGAVGIDMIAGPSEILVIADKNNDPAWTAMDLLSQAEHDESAQSILITDDAEFANRVKDAVEGHLKTLPRADIARKSWQDFGAVLVVENMDQAVALSDRLAPEHLELCVDDPRALMAKVRHAGAIFLGRYTPEAIGDYVAGTNHVLPTARSARFASGLSVFDFMKRTTYVECDAESLAKIGPAAVTLAESEGLQAHGRSVSIRLN